MPVAKPIKLQRRHNTNAEKAQRAAAEQAMKTGENWRESPEVKAEPVAHQQWLRLRKLYKKIGIEIIDALEENLINDYCLEVARAERLRREEEQTIALCESEDAGSPDWRQHMLLLDRVRGRIHASNGALQRMGRALLLDPQSRLQAAAKAPPKEEPEDPFEVIVGGVAK